MPTDTLMHGAAIYTLRKGNAEAKPPTFVAITPKQGQQICP